MSFATPSASQKVRNDKNCEIATAFLAESLAMTLTLTVIARSEATKQSQRDCHGFPQGSLAMTEKRG